MPGACGAGGALREIGAATGVGGGRAEWGRVLQAEQRKHVLAIGFGGGADLRHGSSASCGLFRGQLGRGGGLREGYGQRERGEGYCASCGGKKDAEYALHGGCRMDE